MVTAKFGSKKFEVSTKKIYTPDGLSLSEAINIEEVDRTGLKSATYIKGIKLQTLSFSLQLDARFVSVATEMRWWKNTLLSKKSYDFSLGNYKIGKFHLTQYSVTDIVMNKKGELIKATLALAFTEHIATSTTGNSSNSSSGSGSSGGSGGSVSSGSSSSSSKSSSSASTVKTSATTTTGQQIRVGSNVTPHSGTMWYGSPVFANNKATKYGSKATLDYFKIKSINSTYPSVVQLSNGKYMRIEDVKLANYQAVKNDRV